MKKEFDTLAVLGVYTGRVLEEGGMNGIHEVMDHFYPGIMTIGLAVMADRAKEEVLAQHPELAELPECTGESYKDFVIEALKKLPKTLPLEGPL